MDTSKLAMPELAAIEVGGMTRGAFVVRAALAAGAVYGIGAVAPFVRSALAQGEEGQGDIEILNFALTLERLEAQFYQEALKKVRLSSAIRSLTEEIRTNEVEHVAALAIVIEDLGGKPVQNLTVDFGDAFSSQASYLELAQTFEDTGVAAYNGSAVEIESRKVLAQAGTIVQIEGRHAALIRLARGRDITPFGAIDAILTPDQVRQRVDPFIKD